MRRAALAATIVLMPTVGCGAVSEGPVRLVDEPRTIELGSIGAPLVVDGDALVHVAYAGRASPSKGVLARARDGADCGAKVSVHNLTPAREVLVSEVRVSCGRRPRGSLTLRLHGAAGARTVLRRQISPDRAFRLITEPVLRAGVGGARMFVADPDAIEIVEPTGRREVIRRPSSEIFAGAEINDHGDLLFHAASERSRTSLVRRGQTEPVELVEAAARSRRQGSAVRRSHRPLRPARERGGGTERRSGDRSEALPPVARVAGPMGRRGADLRPAARGPDPSARR